MGSQLVRAVTVAGVAGGILSGACAERPGRAELLAMRNAIHVGMPKGDVLQIVQTIGKHARVGGGEHADAVVAYEGGSSVDWVLRVSFCGPKVVAVQIHTQDSHLEHPRQAPPDEESSDRAECRQSKEP